MLSEFEGILHHTYGCFLKLDKFLDLGLPWLNQKESNQEGTLELFPYNDTHFLTPPIYRLLVLYLGDPFALVGH